MPKKQLTEKEVEVLRYLRNAIVHEGFSPSVRDLMRTLGCKSPRTAFLILQGLIEQGWIRRKADGELQFRKDLPVTKDHARTVEVPLVGNVACGAPLLAEQNIEAHVPVATTLARPGQKHFLLRAIGNSMNEAGINDGDLVLVRQQAQADNGDKVVALIDDEATIKEFHRERGVVVLKPRSKDKSQRPIVLGENFMIQGVVIATISKFD
jgi:repressor LexA